MVKILIIDDSNVSRMIVKKSLKSLNAEIIEAANGEIGLGLAKKEKPDVITLDLLMPGMSGMEFLARCREEGLNIPMIVISADIQDSVVKRVKEMEAEYIKKPVKGDTLTKKIKKILGEI